MADAFQSFAFQTNAFEVGTPLATLTADAGSYTLAGQAASLEVSGQLDAFAGSYSLAGQTARLFRSYTLISNAGSYTLTGQNNRFFTGKTMPAGAATYTLSGQVANLKQTHIEPFAPGFFPVTGQTARLFKSYTLVTGFTSGDRVFQADAFQGDMVQTFVSQNDLSIQGKDVYWHYLKSGTKVYVVV
jgi:hypothetical protein